MSGEERIPGNWKSPLGLEDDELLEELGRFSRAQEADEKERFDPRLYLLCEGVLSAEEEEALLRDAEESEELRLDYDAFRPLGEDFKRRAFEALANTERSPGGDQEEDVAPFRPRKVPRRRRFFAVAALLAMAVLGPWLWRQIQSPVDSSQKGDLPAYTFKLEGERSELRGSEGAPPGRGQEDIPQFLDGDRFRLVLRPEEKMPPDTESRLFLADELGRLEPWLLPSPVMRRSADGSVRIEGEIGEDLDLEPGLYTLIFLYGKPPETEEWTDLNQLDGLGAAQDWRQVRIPFRITLAPLVKGSLPLDVLYAGCFDVQMGPSCVPYESLTIWARSEPAAEIEIWVDGERRDVEGEAVDGGLRFWVPVEIRAVDKELISRRLEVRANLESRRSSFELGLSPFEQLEWLRQALHLAMAGHTDEARQALLRRLEIERPGAALSLLARLPGSEDNRRIAWLEEAVEKHRGAGSLLAMADDFGMLASLDLAARRFADLRRRLLELETYRSHLPSEGVFHLDYYRGILENDLGNARGALVALEEATSTARRLGLPGQLALAAGEKALLLQRLGRGEEAKAIFASLDVESIPGACPKALWQNNQAWTWLESGSGADRALALLDRAQSLVEANDCGGELLNVHLNRALAFLMKGQFFEAREVLGEVDKLIEPSTSALYRLWRQDAEGRLMMASGRFAEALTIYQVLEDMAEMAFEPRALWRAKLQQAAALEGLGEIGAALDALAAAEGIVERQGLEVPLGAGRDNFLADRALGTRRRLGLLLRLGLEPEAFEVARKSRLLPLRALRQGHRLAHLSAADQARWDLQIGHYLDRRAAIEEAAAGEWKWSAATSRRAESRRSEATAEALRALDAAFQIFELDGVELAPPAPGEAMLLFHPLEEGWVAFAADREGLESQLFELEARDLADGNSLRRLLLEPFRPMIERNKRLRFLAHGALREADFHALPWDDGVLLETLPIVYGLDLATSRKVDSEEAESGFAPGDGAALLISDTRGDLAAARLEADGVERALMARFGRGAVTRLEGIQATLPEVLLRLPGVELLHFAGHSQAAGAFGWESALWLAERGRFSVGDILASEAPVEVVLSSCESARDAGVGGFGLGLAQAFLVAGSERVIASMRPVGDSATAELFRHFYGAQGSVAERLRVAQLAWRAAEPEADWASFRLLVP